MIPKSVGSVGRDELAKRIDDFEGGRWVELLEAAVAFIRSKPTLAKPTLAIVIRPTLAKPTLAKVGHTTKTLTMAKVGPGQTRPKRLAKVGLAKVGHDLSFRA